MVYQDEIFTQIVNEEEEGQEEEKTPEDEKNPEDEETEGEF